METENLEMENKEAEIETDTQQEEARQQDREQEIKRLQAQLEKQKLAMDKAAKEAAEYKKKLRAKESTEEQEAEEARERQEAMEQELNELRKKSAVEAIAKRAVAFLGDEAQADALAQALYGAEDSDAAMDSIQKAWTAREKKLRLEFSKLPPPAGGDGAPGVTREELRKMNYRDRAEFARKFPDTYKNLTK